MPPASALLNASPVPWRHRLIVRYYRAQRHPVRLRLLNWAGRFSRLDGLRIETKLLQWAKHLLRVEGVRTEVAPQVVMELDDSDYVDREILLHGGYELATLALFDRLIEDARGFVDIGAHHGQYSLRAARRLGQKGGRAVAFEPLPVNASRLLHSAKLSNLTNIDLFSVALSDAAGIARMFLPQLGNTGAARIFPCEGTDTEQIRIHVAVRTLAEVSPLLPPESFDLVKVDVEGQEARVLTSLFAAPVPRPRNLIIEYIPSAFDYGMPDGLPAWLSNLGYDVRDVLGRPFSADAVLPDHNLWAVLRA